MIRARKSSDTHNQVAWLPVDSRLIPHIFAFGRLGKIAKFFLIIEIILSLLVVIGTFALVILNIIS